jgi:hypothetical protein
MFETSLDASIRASTPTEAHADPEGKSSRVVGNGRSKGVLLRVDPRSAPTELFQSVWSGCLTTMVLEPSSFSVRDTPGRRSGFLAAPPMRRIKDQGIAEQQRAFLGGERRLGCKGGLVRVGLLRLLPRAKRLRARRSSAMRKVRWLAFQKSSPISLPGVSFTQCSAPTG